MPCISFATNDVVQGLIFRYRIFQYKGTYRSWVGILRASARNVNANIWQSHEQAGLAMAIWKYRAFPEGEREVPADY